MLSIHIIDPWPDSDKDVICAGWFYMEHKRYLCSISFWLLLSHVGYRSLCGVHVPDHKRGTENSRCVPGVFLLHIHCMDGAVTVMNDNFIIAHNNTKVVIFTFCLSQSILVPLGAIRHCTSNSTQTAPVFLLITFPSVLLAWWDPSILGECWSSVQVITRSPYAMHTHSI